ncbi:MAG TPA: thioredoxin domain-containing protein, partial [Gemmataceae bacterium]|nr:thioredoxin domain-containing protein [Gemmataceae bacterium]
TESVQAMLHLDAAEAPGVDAELLRQAINQLCRRFDARYGGFGSAPKFPHPMELRLLLRIADRLEDETAQAMARKTLDLMARGGMYDQLGGGFHRYSTDARWLVPHFEKMLYDNALLVPAYVEAFQVTGEPFYRQIAEETLDYVLREMTSPAGPFFSTQDADSEGEEGKFFVWSAAEIDATLGKGDADLFGSVFDVTGGGNWEGVSILHRDRTDEQDAALLKMPVAELREKIAGWKRRLLEVRESRIKPGRDEKILTAWNGLMIGALALAGSALDKPAYLNAARSAARWLLREMRQPDGRLLRTTLVGTPAKLNGYLEDYAYLIDGLVSLYEATFEQAWLDSARDLAKTLVERFWDAKDAGFFYTGHDHESLIARTKDPHDNATPSGNAMAVTGLLRLAALTGDADLQEKAERTLALFRGIMNDQPLAAGQMLIALDFHLGPVREIVVTGDPANSAYQEMMRFVRAKFRPRSVVAGVAAGETSTLPLLADRATSEPVRVYVCEGSACKMPVTTTEALAMLMT